MRKIPKKYFVGQETFDALNKPVQKGSTRASGLKFGDERSMALLESLCLFAVSFGGFSHRSLRGKIASLMGKNEKDYGSGKMSYDLRRLKLHGLIKKREGRNFYEVTPLGLKIGLFLTKLHSRAFGTGLSKFIEMFDFS